MTTSGSFAVVAPLIVRTAHGDQDKNGKKRGRGDHDAAAPLPTILASPEFAVAAPFLVPRYGEREGQEPRTRDVQEPTATIVPTANGDTLVSATLVGCGGRAGQSRPRGADEPTATQTSKADTCLAAVHLSKYHGAKGDGDVRAAAMDEPIKTLDTQPRFGLVAAFLAQHNTGVVGHSAEEPVSTITQRGTNQAVVSAGLVNMKGSDQRSAAIDAPAPAVCAQGKHVAEVRAFLIKYYGADQDPELSEPLHTVTAKARHGLVMVEGEPYEIADIGMRMLSPRELFRAQGFPDHYVIAPIINGKALTKTSQIRMCGNSVCPPMAAALVRANFAAELQVPIVADSVTDAPLFDVEAA